MIKKCGYKTILIRLTTNIQENGLFKLPPKLLKLALMRPVMYCIRSCLQLLHCCNEQAVAPVVKMKRGLFVFICHVMRRASLIMRRMGLKIEGESCVRKRGRPLTPPNLPIPTWVSGKNKLWLILSTPRLIGLSCKKSARLAITDATRCYQLCGTKIAVWQVSLYEILTLVLFLWLMAI